MILHINIEACRIKVLISGNGSSGSSTGENFINFFFMLVSMKHGSVIPIIIKFIFDFINKNCVMNKKNIIKQNNFFIIKS